jgi:hypothetical protein
MKRGKVLKSLGLLLALLVLQASACDPGRVGGYQRAGRMAEVDPATGDTIITQFWKRGSETTATFKRIPKGNTDRRGEPLPPAASED